MYIPPSFAENRPEELERILREFPLGALVYQSPDGLDAAHIPFILKKKAGTAPLLIAHVAKKNPVWEQVTDGTEVLVIFRGVDNYVSPNWYPSKQETERQAPTWNYQTVHVRGRIRFTHDPAFLRGAVALLTDLQEKRIGEPKPWRLSDGDPDYIAELLTMIVGLEVEIMEMTGKFKLSQNREERDRAGAVDHLRRRGQCAEAEAIIRASGEDGRREAAPS